MRDELDPDELPPLVGGILIGGRSRRMGTAKALLEWEGRSFVERIASVLATVVAESWLLGSGLELPAEMARLPAVADAAGVRGPLAGLLAAFEARPGAAWLVLSCDQPLLSTPTLEWLIGERRSGRIAVLPRLVPGRIEPFPAIYEPGSRAELAAMAARACAAAGSSGAGSGAGSLQPLAENAGVRVVEVPQRFAGDFRGVNTPEEWSELRQGMAAEPDRRRQDARDPGRA